MTDQLDTITMKAAAELIRQARADEREKALKFCCEDTGPEIRAEERKKIGDAIKAASKNWYGDLEKLGALVGPGMVSSAYQQCERIARGGGVDAG